MGQTDELEKQGIKGMVCWQIARQIIHQCSTLVLENPFFFLINSGYGYDSLIFKGFDSQRDKKFTLRVEYTNLISCSLHLIDSGILK